MKKVQETGADFCFRVSKASLFVKGFIASGQKDAILEWKPSEKTLENCRKNGVSVTPLRVRVVRIELGNEVEILVSSLIDKEKIT